MAPTSTGYSLIGLWLTVSHQAAQVVLARFVTRSYHRTTRAVLQELALVDYRLQKHIRTLNPICSALSLSSANTSGCTNSSTLRCRLVGCKYWPSVTASTPAARRSRNVCNTCSRVSPSPNMSEDLVTSSGRMCLACASTARDWR